VRAAAQARYAETLSWSTLPGDRAPNTGTCHEVILLKRNCRVERPAHDTYRVNGAMYKPCFTRRSNPYNILSAGAYWSWTRISSRPLQQVCAPLRDLRCQSFGPALLATQGRVEMWRGFCRSNISVSAPFVWRCLSSSTVAPFPHPAHRTGQAALPHTALGQDLTPPPTARRDRARSSVRARSARKGARVDKSRPCVA
jgi:hypothetical protein